MFRRSGGLVLMFLLAALTVLAQDPTQCVGSTGSAQTFEDSGGAGTFTGTVSNACGALTSAKSDASWVTITSATTFAIGFSVAPNTTSASRSANVTATFGDYPGGPVSFNFSLTQFAKLAITTASLPNGIVGVPYSGQLQITGGSDFMRTISVSSGSPPANLSLNGLMISGTPTTPGSSTFTVQVRDVDPSTGNAFSATQTYTVAIGPKLSLGSIGLPTATVGVAYSAGVSASGGLGPYRWSIISGALPQQLSLDSGSGTISGTPSANTQGTYPLTIQVSDQLNATVSAPVTLHVAAAPASLSITTASLAPATEGTTYGAGLSASGGTPPYSWSAGALPSWLQISSVGQLSGTPPAGSSGSYEITVNVKDGAAASTSVTLSLQVKAAPLIIASASPIPDAKEGSMYVFSFQAMGGKGPYKWSASSLPGFLNLSSGGNLSGVTLPGSAGTYTFTVTVTDALGSKATGTVSFTVDPAPLSITQTSLPQATEGVTYSTTLSVTGGSAPYAWSATGLPTWAHLSSSGVLTGTPPLGSASAVLLEVSVQDANSATQNAQLTLVVLAFAGPDLILSCGNLSFSLPGEGTASSQTCSVISSNFSSIPFTATTDVPWVSLSTGGLTPGRIDVSLNPSRITTGNFSGSIEVSSPGLPTQTIKLSLAAQLGAGILQVFPSKLSVQGDGSQQLTDSLFVQNVGQGDLTFNVLVDVPWLKVEPQSGTLTPGQTTMLDVSILATQLSASAYLGNIEIDSASGNALIPVSSLISKRPKMILSKGGMLLQAPEGNGVSGRSVETFQVLSSNSMQIHYAVQQIGGDGWLTLVGQPSGTATDTSPGIAAFKATSKGLAKGAYYALLRITAPEPFDPLLDFVVVLDVDDASTAPVPDTEPSGLVFSAAGPTSQMVTVYTSSDQPASYQVAVEADNGGRWLSATPLTGMISTGSPAHITVSVDTASLLPGAYRGGVNVSISNLEVRTVNITLIVPSASAKAGTVHNHAATASCTPTALVMTETGLPGNFSTPAAWPSSLAVQLADDCGNPVTDASVVAQFSNGDPSLSLELSNGSTGEYSATWTPVNSVQELTISMEATAPKFNITSTEVVGAVTSTPYPILKQNSTLHNLYPRPGAPLAPGTIVSIYGTALAPAPASASGALPTVLNGTSVAIDGELVPLFYVSPYQINAQLPADLAPDKQYQVLVLANGGYSTPDSILIDPVTPGVAQLTNGQVVAQHQDGSMVTPASPAKPGEYLTIYLAGMGLTNAPVAAGTLSPSSPPASVDAPASVTLDGNPVKVLFAGLTPGFVGLYQINFQVPENAPTGSLKLEISQGGMAANFSLLLVGK